MPTVLDNFPDGISDFIRQTYERKLDDSVRQLEAFYARSFVRPTLFFDLKGHTAGIAWRNQIRLNADSINDPRYAHDMLTVTLPHEVAHCITDQISPHDKPHGRQWALTMSGLGLPPVVCHAYETKAARNRKPTARPHIYSCDCQTHEMTSLIHRRISQGKTYVCKYCREELRFIQTIN